MIGVSVRELTSPRTQSLETEWSKSEVSARSSSEVLGTVRSVMTVGDESIADSVAREQACTGVFGEFIADFLEQSAHIASEELRAKAVAEETARQKCEMEQQEARLKNEAEVVARAEELARRREAEIQAQKAEEARRQAAEARDTEARLEAQRLAIEADAAARSATLAAERRAEELRQKAIEAEKAQLQAAKEEEAARQRTVEAKEAKQRAVAAEEARLRSAEAAELAAKVAAQAKSEDELEAHRKVQEMYELQQKALAEADESRRKAEAETEVVQGTDETLQPLLLPEPSPEVQDLLSSRSVGASTTISELQQDMATEMLNFLLRPLTPSMSIQTVHNTPQMSEATQGVATSNKAEEATERVEDEGERHGQEVVYLSQASSSALAPFPHSLDTSADLQARYVATGAISPDDVATVSAEPSGHSLPSDAAIRVARAAALAVARTATPRSQTSDKASASSDAMAAIARHMSRGMIAGAFAQEVLAASLASWSVADASSAARTEAERIVSTLSAKALGHEAQHDALAALQAEPSVGGTVIPDVITEASVAVPVPPSSSSSSLAYLMAEGLAANAVAAPGSEVASAEMGEVAPMLSARKEQKAQSLHQTETMDASDAIEALAHHLVEGLAVDAARSQAIRVGSCSRSEAAASGSEVAAIMPDDGCSERMQSPSHVETVALSDAVEAMARRMIGGLAIDAFQQSQGTRTLCAQSEEISAHAAGHHYKC